jgi:hypothetical protein
VPVSKAIPLIIQLFSFCNGAKLRRILLISAH